MEWKESLEFVKKLRGKWIKRYRELIYHYSDAPMDGHEAHINACNDLEKEMKDESIS